MASVVTVGLDLGYFGFNIRVLVTVWLQRGCCVVGV